MEKLGNHHQEQQSSQLMCIEKDLQARILLPLVMCWSQEKERGTVVSFSVVHFEILCVSLVGSGRSSAYWMHL